MKKKIICTKNAWISNSNNFELFCSKFYTNCIVTPSYYWLGSIPWCVLLIVVFFNEEYKFEKFYLFQNVTAVLISKVLLNNFRRWKGSKYQISNRKEIEWYLHLKDREKLTFNWWLQTKMTFHQLLWLFLIFVDLHL